MTTARGITKLSKRRYMRPAMAGLAIFVAGLAVAACSGSSHSANSSSSGGKFAAAAPDAQRGAPEQAGGGAAAPAKPGTAPIQPAVLQRSIVHTGQITLRVKDVDTAASQVESAASGNGGYVGGDDRNIDAGRSNATVTLRVPADKFDATLSAIATYGTEQSRTVSTQDVTNQVIDVASRLRTQQASVDRIRALLAQATTVGEIVSIESELTQREADLESLEAQQANLSDLTTLSTITVTLLGPQAVAAKPKPAGFIGGLDRGWHAFVASMVWLLMVIGAILPFGALVGLIWWLVRVVMRRMQTRRPAVAGVAPTTPVIGDRPPEP